MFAELQEKDIWENRDTRLMCRNAFAASINFVAKNQGIK